MPGYDGTGPCGRGPMTGNGRGYCMLKLPETCGGILTGFAGSPGKPVTLWPRFSRVDAISLHCTTERTFWYLVPGIHYIPSCTWWCRRRGHEADFDRWIDCETLPEHGALPPDGEGRELEER